MYEILEANLNLIQLFITHSTHLLGTYYIKVLFKDYENIQYYHFSLVHLA